MMLLDHHHIKLKYVSINVCVSAQDDWFIVMVGGLQLCTCGHVWLDYCTSYRDAFKRDKRVSGEFISGMDSSKKVEPSRFNTG